MGARLEPPIAHRRPARHWLIAAVIALSALAGGVVVWQVGGSVGTTGTTTASTSSWPTRTVGAGSVTVKIQPTRLDNGGAVFKVSFDTHSVELNLDVVATARLVVGSSTWPSAGWTGQGPGGHHREGELRFASAGPATGTATLTIGGLPKAVRATWSLGG